MIDPSASLALSGETSKLQAILMSFKMPLGLFGVERLKLPSALRHLRHTVTMVLMSSGGPASRDATARLRRCFMSRVAWAAWAPPGSPHPT